MSNRSPHHMEVLLAALGIVAAVMERQVSSLPGAEPAAPARAAWMPRGTFGVMTHYLVHPNGTTPEEKTTDLDRVVDQFDLDHFIRQFQETRADWLILTLGQNTGYRHPLP